MSQTLLAEGEAQGLGMFRGIEVSIQPSGIWGEGLRLRISGFWCLAFRVEDFGPSSRSGVQGLVASEFQRKPVGLGCIFIFFLKMPSYNPRHRSENDSQV